MRALDPVPEVWIFNHYALPPDAGAGTRHYDLATRAAERGIRTTIFAASFDHFSRRDRLGGIELLRRERHGSVRFVWLRSIPYRGNGTARLAGMLAYGALAVVAAQAEKGPPDVVIGSSVHPIAALAGYVVARLRRARFMYEIRDLWPQTLVDMGALQAESPVARSLWWLEGFLVRRSEAVICLLPGIGGYLKERGLPSDRVVYLPNAVAALATAGSLPRRMQRRLARWRDDGSFIAIYAGAHGRANALGTLIDAATLLQASGSRVRIALVGDGPDKAALEAVAAGRGLDNIAFFDPVAKRSVQTLLSLGDAALFHLADLDVLRYGISSNKLFDYLLSGLPIVFACRTSNDPVAEAHAGLSIPPEDPEALASTLERMAGMETSELRQMGENGRRYVLLHHSMETVGDRFAELILGSEGAPAAPANGVSREAERRSGRPAGDPRPRSRA
jgi:glycosyltransferase involved in cell wall biosynthesis